MNKVNNLFYKGLLVLSLSLFVFSEDKNLELEKEINNFCIAENYTYQQCSTIGVVLKESLGYYVNARVNLASRLSRQYRRRRWHLAECQCLRQRQADVRRRLAQSLG